MVRLKDCAKINLLNRSFEKSPFSADSDKAGSSDKKSKPPSAELVIKGKTSPKASADSTVTLTHGDRVYWEDDKITKQQLAAYYDQVWEWMAPYLLNRPLKPCTLSEGAGTECFSKACLQDRE